MQSILLKGQVILDENDLSRMNYLIHCPSTNKEVSLTDILDIIYNSKNAIKKLVRICGKVCVNGHSISRIKELNGFEGLYIKEDKYHTQSYHIGNFPVENELFELIGEEIELILEDYTNSISEFITASEDVTDDTATKTA